MDTRLGMNYWQWKVKIRKARQEQLYKRQEFKDRCIEGVFILFLICTIIGLGWLVWYLKSIQE